MKKIIFIFLLSALTLLAAGTLPQNTAILVKLDSTLDSNSAYTGQIFTGTLQSNLTLDNGEIVPAGSKVFGRIIDSASAGNVSGSSRVAITLSEIQVDGFNYGINTNAVGFEGANQTKSTATTAAKTAAVGGLVNKALGNSGSKGAKVGGAVGAGAGALTNTGAIAIRAGEILQFQTTTSVVIGR